jgi:hypothetical protein
MSRINKVNKDHYVQRGRLTPDEMARQRARQIHLSTGRDRVMARAKETAARLAEPASTGPRNAREE